MGTRVRYGLAVVGVAIFWATSLWSQSVDSAGTLVGASPAVAAPGEATQPCTILFFGGGDSPQRLQNLGFAVTIASVGDLTRTNLQNYDVLSIEQAAPASYASQNSEIRDWVQLDGGGAVVTQPNVVGAISLFPTGFEASVSNILWPTFPATASDIIDDTHPITQGLADGDISGPFDTIPLSGLGASWTVLAREASLDVDLALAVGAYGAGRFVLTAGNHGSSADPGTDTYVERLFLWGCSELNAPNGTPVPTSTATLTPTSTATPPIAAPSPPEVPALSARGLVAMLLLLAGVAVVYLARSRP